MLDHNCVSREDRSELLTMWVWLVEVGPQLMQVRINRALEKDNKERRLGGQESERHITSTNHGGTTIYIVRVPRGSTAGRLLKPRHCKRCWMELPSVQAAPRLWGMRVLYQSQVWYSA